MIGVAICTYKIGLRTFKSCHFPMTGNTPEVHPEFESMELIHKREVNTPEGHRKLGDLCKAILRYYNTLVTHYPSATCLITRPQCPSIPAHHTELHRMLERWMEYKKRLAKFLILLFLATGAFLAWALLDLAACFSLAFRPARDTLGALPPVVFLAVCLVFTI